MSGATLHSPGFASIHGGEFWRHLWATLAAWRRRSRERRELLTLSDTEMRDFGIGRSEAIHEASKPFWRC
jgi:uncharacterized protein YjiS (DUF1127 family)